MTREEAIERLKTDIYKYADFTENPNENEFWMAFDMAIETLEQQTCKDAVSREAVLWLFAQNADAVRPYSKTWEKIRDLPSVNPQPKWIPVSEGLPEDEQEILFSTKTGRVHSGKYHDDDSANQWYSHKDKCRAWNNVVIAWMPLPQPYEPQERRDKE